ncbi:MAG: DUF892 family protein [Bacteroidia bacterium]
MQNLFIQHLRTMNDSEEIILKALSAIIKNPPSEQLRSFCNIKLKEKKEIINRLHKIFELLRINPVGEKDNIVRSLIINSETIESDRNDTSRLSKIIFGRAMNIYQLNAYRTAVSCASELYDSEIARLLTDCMNEIKFDKKCFDLLKEEQTYLSEKNYFSDKQFVAA